MEIGKIKNKGQARLFESAALELLTKNHPAIVYAMYFPLIAWLLYVAAVYRHLTVADIVLTFLAGVLFWTFFEYIMHRFVFHMIVESEIGKRIIYTMHGVHHEYPRDRDRLFMPPLPSILLASVLFYGMQLPLGRFAYAFFPGFLLGYLAYGSMHYAIHAFAPPRWLKALWRNHHLHHYKHPDKGFGVSSVLWDIVFGTVPEKD